MPAGANTIARRELEAVLLSLVLLPANTYLANISEAHHAPDAIATYSRTCLYKRASETYETMPYLHPCVRRECLDRLAHGQVCHDFLAAAVHRGHLVDAVESLHDATHPCEGDAAPAQDLHRVVR